MAIASDGAQFMTEMRQINDRPGQTKPTPVGRVCHGEPALRQYSVVNAQLGTETSDNRGRQRDVTVTNDHFLALARQHHAHELTL